MFNVLFKSFFYFNLTFFFLLISCSDSKKSDNNRIVIAIPNDVQTINPIYAFNVIEGHLIDLLFLKPAIEKWNDSLGTIDFAPMLSEKWVWSEDSTSITLYLRDSVYWSDGIPITTDDIVFSFDIYSDPQVESRFLGLFGNFYTIDGSKLDLGKTCDVMSSKIIEINFKNGSFPTLLDINLEIIPKHIWSKYSREEFTSAQENFEPVTSGPFKLKEWEKSSKIILSIDSSSFLFNPRNIKELAFKVVPDYTTRINELKTGDIDLLENLKSEDVTELSALEELKIVSIRGREYDYVGWNHLDPQEIHKDNFIPNKYFSSPQIRKALTYAINREEILQSYLMGFGEICKSPISPMFKKYFDKSLKIDEYNPKKAKEILQANGWVDKNNDGIIENGNIKFEIDIYTNSGNPVREYTATIIKNNLNAIGIEVNIHILESGVFIEGLMKRNYDAWISGWTIPIPIDLNPFWNSDENIGFFIFSTYENKQVDEILAKLQKNIPELDKQKLYYKLQNIFYSDEPVTFLYWIDNIIACDKKMSEIKFSMLGLVKNAWEWRVN
jgi:peptide/nickel transport system substrate-binding protein